MSRYDFPNTQKHYIDILDENVPLAGRGDAGPGIMAVIEKAGGKSGLTSGTKVYSMDIPVIMSAGIYDIGTSILIPNTWFIQFKGDGTETRLRLLSDLNVVIALDGSGYGTFGRFAFSDASGHTAQTVVSIDRTSSAANSVHSLYVDDIDIGDGKWVKAFTAGLNSSNLDMAQVFFSKLRAGGNWTTGQSVLWQEGLHFGNASFGNVLNFSLDKASITNVAKGIVVDIVNMTIRDVFFDGGDIAFSGLGGRHYLSVDGWRIESFNQFCNFAGVDTIQRHFTFKNGNYNDPVSGVHTAANFERAGDIIFENVIWNTQNYASGARSQIRTFTSPSIGRRITFRHFQAFEKPEELWIGGQSDDWKRTWMIFEGYSIGDTSLRSVKEITGLYARSITANVNVQPYDGMLMADSTASAVTVTLPTASFHIGRTVIVQKTGGANTVQFASTAPDLVGGAATLAVAGTTRVMSNGTNWIVV